MKRGQNMKDMEALLNLKFQKKQSVFLKLVAEENRLRAQIRGLDQRAREAEIADTHKIRAIGADVVWKAWVERTKTALNMDLAQILAQKERLQATVRKEYGKVLVSRALAAEQKKQEAKAERTRQLDTSIASHFFLDATRPRQD